MGMYEISTILHMSPIFNRSQEFSRKTFNIEPFEWRKYRAHEINAIRWNITETVRKSFPWHLKLCELVQREPLKRIMKCYRSSIWQRWNGIRNIECKIFTIVRTIIFLIERTYIYSWKPFEHFPPLSIQKEFERFKLLWDETLPISEEYILGRKNPSQKENFFVVLTRLVVTILQCFIKVHK